MEKYGSAKTRILAYFTQCNQKFRNLLKLSLIFIFNFSTMRQSIQFQQCIIQKKKNQPILYLKIKPPVLVFILLQFSNKLKILIFFTSFLSKTLIVQKSLKHLIYNVLKQSDILQKTFSILYPPPPLSILYPVLNG